LLGVIGWMISVQSPASLPLDQIENTSMDEVEYLNSRTGLPRCKASRLLPPRSGLERSDFVPWPVAEIRLDVLDVGYRGG